MTIRICQIKNKSFIAKRKILLWWFKIGYEFISEQVCINWIRHNYLKGKNGVSANYFLKLKEFVFIKEDRNWSDIHFN